MTELLSYCRRIVPKLSDSSHKGTCGRIGIFGGSVEFTGAPFYAGLSALRTGADLAYVFSAAPAAPVIKSYSPELMVLPYLDATDALSRITPWLQRLHAILIGPGLGRNDKVMKNVLQIIEYLKVTPGEGGMFRPIILDADGLHLLCHQHQMLENYLGEIYLTPNIVEFNNLARIVMGLQTTLPTHLDVQHLSQGVSKSVVTVLKGNIDLIASSTKLIQCNVDGSRRRCGGQGDMLSGALATFAAWVAMRKWTNYPDVSPEYPDPVLAAYSAAALTRACNKAAFKKYSRSMLTSDMLKEIPSVFEEMFEII